MLGSTVMSRLAGSVELVGKDIEDMDITSRSSCAAVIKEFNPTVVINASAYTDVDGSESNRDKCFAVNADGVKNLAIVCKENDSRLVHISTDYVFNGQKITGYKEDDATDPLNVYGEAKLEGECYLKENCDDYLLIRTAWLYGLRGKNFVKTILAKAREGNDLTVVDDQIGSPTYCWDLAGAIKLLLDGGNKGTFHVVNRGSCSWFGFTQKVLQLRNISDVKVSPTISANFPRPAPRPACSLLDCSAFTNSTGRVMRPWQLALADFLEKLPVNEA